MVWCLLDSPASSCTFQPSLAPSQQRRSCRPLVPPPNPASCTGTSSPRLSACLTLRNYATGIGLGSHARLDPIRQWGVSRSRPPPSSSTYTHTSRPSPSCSKIRPWLRWTIIYTRKIKDWEETCSNEKASIETMKGIKPLHCLNIDDSYSS
jgi:hypothetical protein